MDFVNIIGKNFENISFNKNEYSIEFEDEEWEEGIEPKWTVNAKDGSFSMSLNKDKSIETVWLYPVNGQFRFENYSNETTRELVRSKYGIPTSQREVEESILQEIPISWDRYDTEYASLHFEYSLENSKLRMITIMDSRIAP